MIRTAESINHGKTWTCSKPISTNTAQAIFPWLAATSHGVDLVYYGAPTKTNQTWYVYFAQSTAGTPTGWGTPAQLMSLHKGAGRGGGASGTTGPRLCDDFGAGTHSRGSAHTACP